MHKFLFIRFPILAVKTLKNEKASNIFGVNKVREELRRLLPVSKGLRAERETGHIMDAGMKMLQTPRAWRDKKKRSD